MIATNISNSTIYFIAALVFIIACIIWIVRR